MWWVATALALRVDVLPDPEPARRERLPGPAATPLVPERGDVVVDGALDEPAWGGEALPLLPLQAGPRPPAATLRAVVAPDGVALGVTGVPAGWTSTVALDADGGAQRWWRVTLGADAVVEVCSLDDEEATDGWYIPPGAVPCRSEAGPRIASGPGGVEILVPWASVPTASTRARVAWTVTGPGGAGGTLAVSGSPVALPSAGRPLPLPGPPAALQVASDADAGVWRGELSVRRGEGAWGWSRVSAGRVIDAGSVSVDGPGVARWVMPDLDRQDVLVVLRPPRGPVGLSAEVRRRRYEVRVGSPVGRGAVELAWETPDPAAWRVTVDGQGAVDVDVPAGAGRLRVTPDVGGPLRLRVEERLGEAPRVLLDAGVIVEVAR